MYVLHIENAMKTMVKDLKEFIFVNNYKQIDFTENNSYYYLVFLGKVREIFSSIFY